MANRHGTFHTSVRNGTAMEEYDALDDDYDYDEEDYYDEDQYDYTYDHNSGGGGGGKGGSAATVAVTTGKGKQQQQSAKAGNQQQQTKAPTQPAKAPVATKAPAHELDDDVLMPVYRQVRPVVSSSVSDDTIKKVIRDNNYDPDATVDALLALEETSTATAKQPPVKKDSTATTGGRTLTLGGGGEKKHDHSKPHHDHNHNHHHHHHHGNHHEHGEGAPAKAKSPFVPTGDMKVKGDVTDADGRSMLHLVLSGHVDSGKSTILGHLLVLLGEVDERVVNKFEQQCKATGKATFQYAWVLDSSEEERRRGVTIDAAQQSFKTGTKRVIVLDAPGHKQFVVNMISSATQADVALLVVTCQRGEFESGLNVGTLEHLQILRTLGVTQIIVALNKMDSCDWSEERYKDCILQLQGVLKQTRFKDEDVLGFCPVSGLTGCNLTADDGTAKKVMPWYKGPSLIELIDSVAPVERMTNYPLRCTVSDAFKHTVCCKIEAGTVKVGDNVVFVPSGVKFPVKGIERVGFGFVKEAKVGDAVELTTSSTHDIAGICTGNVGCPQKTLCAAVTTFEAHIQTFETLQRALIPGTQLTMSLHTITSPVTIDTLISVMDKKGQWSKGFVKCVRKEQQAMVLFRVDNSLAMELADDVRTLGRFVLRLDGEMAGGGFVKRLGPA